MITSGAFSGRSYAVYGLARSGLATVEALLAGGASVMAWDEKEEARQKLRPTAEAALRIADPLVTSLYGFAGIVVSPGVPLNRHPIAARAREAKVPLTGDIELFAQARASLPPHKVVGITGTNGKSTTTALIHHIARTAGIPTLMGGNIGLPILAQDPLPAGGVYVLELSSYQIDLTQSLDCEVAVLLNVSPDHLDRYDGMDDYAGSKARLFAMQSQRHAAVIAGDDDYTRALAGAITGRLVLVSARDVKDSSQWPSLQGPHNAQNVAAAVAAARELGVADAAIAQALESFPGLPHRMERVAERGGVLFVNDSKATNPASAAPALAAYPAVHWILGGRPKSDDLDACEPWLGHVRAAYTIGEAGPRFAALLRPRVAVSECGELGRAVGAAAAAAREGEVVLLSPACASFDQFTDYEARGNAFRAAVEAL
ncbi:MAG: UDP-N-acetylmuramoyl-L-alanine--D-glutamate ligase [Alphaproteobacteria bacterium]|nr:UDP-N-acetylmuramoyl-L-alanine--D-glutamate ligase [Alphaproteobacteria bacterium]MBV9371641.1 UDP-N-acetylmuramoyl-L-alanine--D-glutamate ligase [Alphaproteobacteria bacterium]MBV9900358.1 UDP-N-acetylmuramoyl-L-alanine--D-glutamate ligase [Alphaproteobacteria bacterium]